MQTSRGTILTNRVLLCAGIWGPRIGKMAGVPVSLIPVEHQYARTAPVRELAGETREVVHPVLRHQDRAMYFRQHADCYGIGSYQHEPLPLESEKLPAGESAIRPFTPSHFEKAHADAVDLFPCLRDAEITTIFRASGGEVVYGYELYGVKACFAVGWCLALGYVALTTFEALSLGWVAYTLFPGLKGAELYTARGTTVDTGTLVIGLGGIALLGSLNDRGAAFAAAFQESVTYLKIGIAAVCIGVGILYGHGVTLHPLFLRSETGSIWSWPSGRPSSFTAW